MKRNFPKLIALSLIISLSITLLQTPSNSNIKAKIRSMCKLMSRTRVFPTDVRNLAQKTIFLMLLHLIKSIIKSLVYTW